MRALQGIAASAVDVAQSSKRKEESCSTEVRHCGGPGSERIGYVELRGDAGQDDVEPRDVEFGHHHGQEHGEDEAELGEGIAESFWSLSAETLEFRLVDSLWGVILGKTRVSASLGIGRHGWGGSQNAG